MFFEFSNIIKAFLFMIGAIFSFTLMAISGRALSENLDTFEIMTYRSILGLVLVLLVGKFFNTLNQINIKKLYLHLIRNFFHFIGQNCWLYAIIYIPLSQMFAFEFSTPLWVVLIAPFILNESFKKSRLIAVFIGFVGVLIVSRPEIDMINYPIIAAALCSVFFSTMTVTTKILTRTESTTCILFWLTLMQGIFGLICSGYDLEFNIPNANNYFFILVISLSGLFAHFCIVSALSLAPASVVTPIEFLRLPLVIMVGIFIYGEVFEWEVLIGGVIILFSNFYILKNEHKIKVKG